MPLAVPFYMDVFVIGLLGLALGSFASVFATREVLEGEPPATGQRSRCHACQAKLGVLDLIPLLSWLFLRGRCRHCGAGISPLYPLLELASALACIVAYIMLGPSWAFLAVLGAIPVLLALFVIDLRLMILPNKLVLALAVLGVLYQILAHISLPSLEGLLYIAQNKEGEAPLWGMDEGYNALPRALIEYGGGAVLYAGLIWLVGAVMQKILKKEALGLGDVKFFGAAGLWLGLSNMANFMMLSGILGVIIAIFQKLSGNHEGEGGLFPFGPALVASLYLILVFGNYNLSY